MRSLDGKASSLQRAESQGVKKSGRLRIIVDMRARPALRRNLASDTNNSNVQR